MTDWVIQANSTRYDLLAAIARDQGSKRTPGDLVAHPFMVSQS